MNFEEFQCLAEQGYNRIPVSRETSPTSTRRYRFI